MVNHSGQYFAKKLVTIVENTLVNQDSDAWLTLVDTGGDNYHLTGGVDQGDNKPPKPRKHMLVVELRATVIW